MPLVLGIDIGTTSVKALILDNTLKHECFCSKNTEAAIEHSLHKEQDTNKIMQCIDNCLQTLLDAVGPACMAQIAVIAPCCQMHGCVFWNSHKISMDLDLSKSYGSDAVSNLITWQDSRCTEEFLASLPLSRNFPQPLSSGFGCATIMWLKKHNPEFLSKYDSCGTIGDYLVTRICALIKPVMSNHNCASWGYYNPQNRNWDLPTMNKANFPVTLLPVVAYPGTKAGKLCSDYKGMTHETNVVIAMGDMQCSVMSCQIRPNEGVINISTSAQLSVLVERETKSFSLPSESIVNSGRPPPVTRVPYFKEKDLLTSASLNGGSVFDNFVDMLTEWTSLFVPEITKDQVYEKIINEAVEKTPLATSSALQFDAQIYGERHSPDAKAAFRNIVASNFNMSVIAHSIVRGILQNVRNMFESGDYPIKNLLQLRACGGAFKKNVLFKQLLPKVFHDTNVTFMKDYDAAFGAALSVFTGTS